MSGGADTTERLRRLRGGEGTSLWVLPRRHGSELSRYVASSPEGRRLCNFPEVVGFQFTRHLRAAVARALGLLPELDGLVGLPEESLCVVHLLRGGLSFSLREALFDVMGCVAQSSCFLSSQRKRTENGWEVVEDSYRKLRLPERPVLLIGDVVATGITARHGLEIVNRELERIGTVPRRLLFFTVGCDEIEAILEGWHRRWASLPGYEGTSVVYLEGRFRLESEEGTLPLGLPGTDLIRRDAELAPELVLSQYEELAPSLERCVVYDAGSRAFDVLTYREEVLEYWTGMERLALGELCHRELRDLRWPEPWRSVARGPEEWIADRWEGIDEETRERLRAALAAPLPALPSLAELARGRSGALAGG